MGLEEVGESGRSGASGGSEEDWKSEMRRPSHPVLGGTEAKLRK